MTNKEAIKALKWQVGYAKEIGISHIDGVYVEALDLAVKALEFAESQTLCCDNCVNRTRKSKEVCTSPYGMCEFFDDKNWEAKDG